MRHDLLLDIQGAQSRGHGERGIARYVTEHARSLMRRSNRINGLLLSPFLPFPGNLPAELLSSPLLRWNTATERARHRAPIAYHVMSPFELHDPTTGVVPPHLIAPEIPLIITLYDLIPYFWPQHYLADAAWEQRYKQRLELVRSADLLLTISDATRADTIRVLGVEPERIVTIGGGVARQFSPPPPGSDPLGAVRRRLPRIRGRYVFSVSAPDWRKNSQRLISAYAMLPSTVRRDLQLVITCHLPGSIREQWMAHALGLGLDADEVVLTGRVDEDTLVTLYQAATVFVFPSLYEGFGLPVAEAIACGARAITSNTSSLPEVLDHPGATFDPNDTDNMAQVLERSLVDTELRRELLKCARRRAPLFQWDRVAGRTIVAVDSVIDRIRRPAHRRTRLRLALVTPLAPDPSAVASYNARLIPHLGRHVDLDVLYPELGGKPLLRWPGVPCLPLDGLGRFINPYSYDAIIYAIGDGAVHVPTYDAAMRYPGIVWFHETSLGQLYRSHAAALGVSADQVIRDQLRRFYAKRDPEHAVDSWTPDLVERYGLHLTPEIVQRARHAIVPTHVAAHLLRLDQGGDVRCPEISVLPWAGDASCDDPPMSKVEPSVIRTACGRTDTRLDDAIAFIPEERRPRVATSEIPLRELTCLVHLRSCPDTVAVREALALGLPVITVGTGIDDEYPPGTVMSLTEDVSLPILARQIDLLCSQDEVWLGYSRAARKYSATFTAETVAAQLFELVSRAIAHGETAR